MVRVSFALGVSLLLMGQGPTPQGARVIQRKLPTGAAVNITVPPEAPTTIKTSDLSLQTNKVLVPADRDVQRLLAAQGLAVTPQAIGLFYDLNPGIDDIRKVPSGATVVLPKAVNRTIPAAAMADYKLQLVTADKASIDAAARHTELITAARVVSDVNVRRFSRPELRDRFVRAIQQGQALVADTLSGKYPLSQKVLTETAHYTAVLTTAARAAAGAAPPLQLSGPSAADIVQESPLDGAVGTAEDATNGLKGINDDLKNGGSGTLLIKVATVRTSATGNGAVATIAVPALSVCFHAKWNNSALGCFHNVTSPASETLVLTVPYELWVEDGATPSHQVSACKEITVTRGQTEDNTIVVDNPIVPTHCPVR